jgi:hypothetical protein
VAAAAEMTAARLAEARARAVEAMAATVVPSCSAGRRGCSRPSSEKDTRVSLLLLFNTRVSRGSRSRTAPIPILATL